MSKLRRFHFALLVAVSLFLAVPATQLRAADIVVTAANVVPSSQAHYAYGTSGATLTAGMVVYFDAVSSTYKIADANLSAIASTVAGIAANNASSGQPLTVITYDPALAVGGTVAAGTIVILSATDNVGAIAPAADAASGWYVTALGVGGLSNKIFFQPVGSGVPK